MRAIPVLWSVGLAAISLSAPAQGVPPEWETRKLIDSVVANAKKLEPLVNAIDPARWKEQGAPDAYVAQWKSVRNALGGLTYASSQFAKEPTRITYAMETLFKLDAINVFLGSFASGVRKYQNPAMADLLLGVADENAANREKLRQYTYDLAESKEAELKVMESEAQRCLGMIVKEAPAATQSRTTTKAKLPTATPPPPPPPPPPAAATKD